MPHYPPVDESRDGLHRRLVARRDVPTAESTGVTTSKLSRYGPRRKEWRQVCQNFLTGGRIMSRAKLLLIAFAGLTLALSAAGDPPAPPVKNPSPDARFVGRWMLTFSNGVIESCEVHNDGSASESETLRSSEGKVSQQGGVIVVTFADDRVERWTAVGKRMVVEHWFPAAAYPAGEKVVGIADRVQQ
jgi:hypothetical protein